MPHPRPPGSRPLPPTLTANGQQHRRGSAASEVGAPGGGGLRSMETCRSVWPRPGQVLALCALGLSGGTTVAAVLAVSGCGRGLPGEHEGSGDATP